ncbi:MAG: DinB family protein, partial [Propionicimonas sp.]|nr:DinB family protein [Propionicimonas sp.]
VLGIEQPFHPLGQAGPQAADDGLDLTLFTPGVPAWEDVLLARAGRVSMVREFLSGVTAGDLSVQRPNPWDARYPETVLSCLHTILEEEWEHLRYALRDLDTIAAGG